MPHPPVRVLQRHLLLDVAKARVHHPYHLETTHLPPHQDQVIAVLPLVPVVMGAEAGLVDLPADLHLVGRIPEVEAGVAALVVANPSLIFPL